MSSKKLKNRKSKNYKKILLFLSDFLLVISILIVVQVFKIYQNVESTANGVFKSVRNDKESTEREINLSEESPLSILLLGIDTGNRGHYDQGRSDTVMVATINPSKNVSLLTSLPRDTYTKIVGHNTQDKLNHAYAFGGVAMSMATVENLLDIPINYYVTINMEGIKDLVNALGGIEVSNKFEFTYGKTTFIKGRQNLNGTQALKYSRMRYDDLNGDYGRQERQRQIVLGITKKLFSLEGLSNYQSILKTVGSNIRTDLSLNDMCKFFGGYLPALKHVKSDQMKGKNFIENGISYQYIDSNELERVKNNLHEILE